MERTASGRSRSRRCGPGPRSREGQAPGEPDNRKPRNPVTEPETSSNAPADMSAQLRPGGALSPSRVARAGSPHHGDPAEEAFDRWLRHELGLLYDAALAEPLPDQLTKLLEEVPADGERAG
jgi:hypothetical protein